MASEGSMTFDEYYDLFVPSTRSIKVNYNPWQLVNYYMLADTKYFKIDSKEEANKINNQEKKSKIVYIGRAIFNSFIERKGEDRFRKDVLGGLAHAQIHTSWLRNQFEKLPERYDKYFDYDSNWKLLCVNEKGEESVYELLYLFRIMWTELIRGRDDYKIESSIPIETVSA
jgi:hypothetical protein